MDVNSQKELLYRRALAEARGFDLTVLEEHSSPDKPWGAYLRIAESSLPQFYQAYWQGVEIPAADGTNQLDPKILIVAPGARLSLQHHARRGEHWRVLDGPVTIVLGSGFDSLDEIRAKTGDTIRIPQGRWHRLVGGESWGRIAEIWEHTIPGQPSDENDIVREQDDFGR